jgi:hypothetical protein
LNSGRIYQNPRCRFRGVPQCSSRYWSQQTSLHRNVTTSHPGQGGEGGELRKYISANSYARYASIAPFRAVFSFSSAVAVLARRHGVSIMHSRFGNDSRNRVFQNQRSRNKQVSLIIMTILSHSGVRWCHSRLRGKATPTTVAHLIT